MNILIRYKNYRSRQIKQRKVIIDSDVKGALIFEHCDKTIIYCSIKQNNIYVLRKIADGEKVVYIKDNKLIIFDGEDKLPIVKIPVADDLSVEKIVYLAAILYSCEISFFKIRRFLKNIF